MNKYSYIKKRSTPARKKGDAMQEATCTRQEATCTRQHETVKPQAFKFRRIGVSITAFLIPPQFRFRRFAFRLRGAWCCS